VGNAEIVGVGMGGGEGKTFRKTKRYLTGREEEDGSRKEREEISIQRLHLKNINSSPSFKKGSSKLELPKVSIQNKFCITFAFLIYHS
jgi:hypothetical protein